MHYNKRKSIRKALKNLTRIIPSAFWLLLIFSFDKPYFAILTVICAVIHECGHMLASYALGKMPRISATAVGFRIRNEKMPSYGEDIAITAAGPLINFIIALPAIALLGTNNYILQFGAVNLFTALSNLLPVFGYDGYRILKLTADAKCAASKAAYRVLDFISSAIISLFCFFSLYLMAKLNSGYWIFFIFIFALIKSLSRDKRCFL